MILLRAKIGTSNPLKKNTKKRKICIAIFYAFIPNQSLFSGAFVAFVGGLNYITKYTQKEG